MKGKGRIYLLAFIMSFFLILPTILYADDVQVILPGAGDAFNVEQPAGTIRFEADGSGNVSVPALNCTGNANGGKVTTNASGRLQCGDDNVGVANCSEVSNCSAFTTLENRIGRLETLVKAAAGNVKIVFVTSSTYRGDLGGQSGADTKCQARADAASLPGTYMAWLSSATISAIGRFTTHSTFPYGLVNGNKVADDWYDLTDGSLDHAIDRDQNGNLVTGTVWTNTKTDGTVKYSTDTTTCSSWTVHASIYQGRYGLNSYTDTYWTDSAESYCNAYYRLYCFQQ
jgi:hypothetical protein